MILVTQLRQGRNSLRTEISFIPPIQFSDKDDDSTADEEDLLHSRVKRRTGRSPNTSQIPINTDVGITFE